MLVAAIAATVFARTSSRTDGSGSQTTVEQAATATAAQTAWSGDETKTQAAASGDSSKADNSGNYQPTVANAASPGAPPADTSGLASLSCSLTAGINPDNSLSMTFYVQGPGYFTVQEKIAGSWKTTLEKIFYAGTGGIDAGSMPSGEDSRILRLLKIENGKYTSVSKEFTVSRQEVISAGGLKTY